MFAAITMATETFLDMLSTNSEDAKVERMTIFVALLCACIVIGHLLEENRWINESITALVIGVCTGSIILLINNGSSLRNLSFSEDLFFIYLLPPIIFNAGFQVKKKQFFRNFMTIILFGAVGTLISFCIISLGAAILFKKMNIGGSLKLGDFLAIGAIFSATDSVCTLQVLNQDETPFLYSLVFGEGVVNDATSVVLFNAILRFDLQHMNWRIGLDLLGNFFNLFIASTALGVLSGLLSAFIIKKLYFGRHSTDREVALMILMAYLSYVVAERSDLSSILTVFFCGIVMSHYTWHNVTESSRVTTKHTFATMSFVAEIFIFLYVGMDALDKEKWKSVSSSPGISIAVSSIILALVMIGRAAFVFPLSYLSNLTKKPEDVKIEFKEQVTIWWSGLMRGAVSMALAYHRFSQSASDGDKHDEHESPDSALVITSTITVVLFSTVVFGLMTKPLVRLLLPPSRNILILNSPPVTPKSFTEPLLGDGSDSPLSPLGRPSSLRILLSIPTQGVHRYWRKFDDAVMRPIFGGRGFVPYVPGSPLEQSVHQLQ